MCKRKVLVLALILLLAACTSSGEEEASTPLEEQAMAAPSVEPVNNTPQARPTQTPTDIPESTPDQVAQATVPQAATAVVQPTSPPQPTETAAPAFNGEYEGTFYRGSATAPITMIDYSDFL